MPEREYCLLRMNRSIRSIENITLDVNLVVDIAEDGIFALRLAKRNTYALVLLDLQMPKMSGTEAALAIRALATYKNTPILATPPMPTMKTAKPALMLKWMTILPNLFNWWTCCLRPLKWLLETQSQNKLRTKPSTTEITESPQQHLTW